MMVKHRSSVQMGITATVFCLAILSTPLLSQAAEIRFLKAQEESRALGSDQQGDKIYKTDGTILEGKVLKITETTIEFDPIGDTPYIPIPRQEVLKIVYSDGREVEVTKLESEGEHKEKPAEKTLPQEGVISQPEEESYLQICAQAEADAKRDEGGATGYCIGGLLCGVFGLLFAVMSSPKPPAARLIGKSDKYVFAYTQCYEKKAKSIRRNAACTGWAISAAVNIVIFAATGGLEAE